MIEDFNFMQYFLIPVYSGLKFRLSLLDVAVLRLNFRNSSLSNVTCKNSPSARCFSAVNVVCGIRSISLAKVVLYENRFCDKMWLPFLINLPSLNRYSGFLYQYRIRIDIFRLPYCFYIVRLLFRFCVFVLDF
jgi:hypothetical protein